MNTFLIITLTGLSILSAVIAIAASKSYYASERKNMELRGKLADMQVYVLELEETSRKVLEETSRKVLELAETLRKLRNHNPTTQRCDTCPDETFECKKLECHGGYQVCVANYDDSLDKKQLTSVAKDISTPTTQKTPTTPTKKPRKTTKK